MTTGWDQRETGALEDTGKGVRKPPYPGSQFRHSPDLEIAELRPILKGRNINDLELKVHIEVDVAISFGLEVSVQVLCNLITDMEIFMNNTIDTLIQTTSNLINTAGGALCWTVHALTQMSLEWFAGVFACIWCGVAVLRSPDGGNSNPSGRDRRFAIEDLALAKRTAGGSTPLLRTNSLQAHQGLVTDRACLYVL